MQNNLKLTITTFIRIKHDSFQVYEGAIKAPRFKNSRRKLPARDSGGNAFARIQMGVAPSARALLALSIFTFKKWISIILASKGRVKKSNDGQPHRKFDAERRPLETLAPFRIWGDSPKIVSQFNQGRTT